MATESELYYLCVPREIRPVTLRVEFLPVQEFVSDERACKMLWDLVSSQFRTRGKFLTVWPGVRFVALHRDPDGLPDGFLLVTSPINWQIDYVVVRPDRRGHGIAQALLVETLNRAFHHAAPYVMLTSKESLRPLYESCGFTVVGQPASAVHA